LNYKRERELSSLIIDLSVETTEKRKIQELRRRNWTIWNKHTQEARTKKKTT